jgi:S1-C subfamily serine protease
MYERMSPEEAAPTAWSGTCFAIEKNLLVTNHHVVNGATNLTVRGVGGNYSKKYPLRVIAANEKTDLALIEITDPTFEGFDSVPLKLNPRLIEVGTSVYAYGYPMITTMGDELKLTSGIVSARSGFQGDLSAYQISTPIQGGNSGGPLITENGDVIGIINAKHGGAENASYAIKMNYLYSLISSAGLEVPLNSDKAEFESIVDLTKEFRKYIFIVEASTR